VLQPNRKTISSFCAADKPQCVVVRYVPKRVGLLRRRQDVVELLDSKLGDASPVERFTLREFRQFCNSAHDILPEADGYRIGDLRYDADEWTMFLRGCTHGDFKLPNVIQRRRMESLSV